MIWLTWKALELDRAEAQAQQDADQEQAVGSALWQMDAEVTQLLAAEIARPPFFYHAFFPNSDGKKGALSPSPLLVQPSPYVRLHFELQPDNSWSSPQCPPPEQYPLAEANSVSLANMDQSRRLLQELSQVVRYEHLLERLPHERLPIPIQPSALLANNAGLSRDQQKYVGSLLDYRAVQQQLEESQNFINQPANSPAPQTDVFNQSRGQQRANIRRGSELQSRNEMLQGVAQQAAVEQRLNRTTLPLRTLDVEGVSKPVWVDGHLVVARRVESGGTTRIQGCWLDWPKIKTQLLDGIRPLLPQADLQPVIDVSAARVSHMLVTLPVQVVVPRAAAAVNPFSPIRVSLVAAWSFLSLATLAFAVLLQGVVKLSERRAAFVSAVTHELRTPLTTFRMYAEMLAAGMVTDAAQRQTYLETLQGEADRLAHLVENVLQYARLERGARGKRREPTALAEFLDRTARRLRDRTAQAGMELQIEVADEARAVTIHTDPAAVEQILFNLVDNACKYAATATDPRIHVGLEAAADVVKLRVRDHGPGIPAGATRRLFRPFSKSARDAANTAPGVGLGLALSRRLAVDLGGWLAAEANHGGADFVLTLPRR
jgi:signal transduction histidine kinase